MAKEKVTFYKDSDNEKDKINVSATDHFLEILWKLDRGEAPTTRELAQEFGRSTRTIQIYIQKLINSGFLIYKDSNHRYHFSYGYSLNKTMLDSNEMILLQLALAQFKEVTDFDKLTDSIYNKLTKTNLFNPYCIKYDDIEDLQIDSLMIQDLEDAIEYKNHVEIQFEDTRIIVEPYKIVAYDGIWYLVAKDEDDQKIKSFLLKGIKALEILKNKYDISHDTIRTIVKKTHSAWFVDGNCFTVTIKVSPKIAYYFKAKNTLQSQKIVEELEDGSLIISFEVSHDEDIDNMIKSWLPDIEILEPQRYKDKIKQELTEYLKKLN